MSRLYEHDNTAPQEHEAERSTGILHYEKAACRVFHGTTAQSSFEPTSRERTKVTIFFVGILSRLEVTFLPGLGPHRRGVRFPSTRRGTSAAPRTPCRTSAN